MGGGWGVVSYPDPYVRNDDHRLQYVMSHTVSDDHRYVHMGLGTRLVGGGGGGGGSCCPLQNRPNTKSGGPLIVWHRAYSI